MVKFTKKFDMTFAKKGHMEYPNLPERKLIDVPANLGTPYVPFFAKVMPKFFVNFSMTLLKIGHMGYSD